MRGYPSCLVCQEEAEPCERFFGDLCCETTASQGAVEYFPVSTASVLVLYLVGSLAAWTSSRRFERAIVIVAVGFSLFAIWGTGAEPVGWGLVLLAIGYVLRVAMHRKDSIRPFIPQAAADPAARRE